MEKVKQSCLGLSFSAIVKTGFPKDRRQAGDPGHFKSLAVCFVPRTQRSSMKSSWGREGLHSYGEIDSRAPSYMGIPFWILRSLVENVMVFLCDLASFCTL